MNITAVVDRIENGMAILLSKEFDIEISIPEKVVKGLYNKDEAISLTIDKNGNIENLKRGVK
jgi:hypothetical protein